VNENAEESSGHGDDGRSTLSKALFPTGTEPDPRFTLANERTFLAWMRTALAFIAGGVALEALPIDTVPGGRDLRNTGALVALCLGIVLAAGAAFRWLRVERAMREQRPLPAPAIVPALSVGAIVVAVVLLLLVLL
jgi:putative membrane protein